MGNSVSSSRNNRIEKNNEIIEVKIETEEGKEQTRLKRKKNEEEYEKYKKIAKWVCERITLVASNNPREFTVELPISSIVPIGYEENLPIKAHLFFKSVGSSEQHVFYEQSFHITSLDGKPLYNLKYFTRTTLSKEILVTIYELDKECSVSFMNITIFIKMIFSKIETLYIDTYDECLKEDPTTLYKEDAFENMGTKITFTRTNTCTKCGGLTKNKEYCYFCDAAAAAAAQPPGV